MGQSTSRSVLKSTWCVVHFGDDHRCYGHEDLDLPVNMAGMRKWADGTDQQQQQYMIV